jgi:pyruvate dehydrogenase E2 component (dihydrolipoamide acetyltransferase)
MDPSPFGPVELAPLSKLQKLAADRLSATWGSVPQVSHHDLLDLEVLEEHRARLKSEGGPRLSPLPFLVRAIAGALQEFPRFNASLDESGTALVIKKFYNVGIVIDTPRGLLIGVVKEVDRKNVATVAAEIATLSDKARTRGLSIAEMTGGTFSVSSLGDLGGTGFTPIINAPEVAMLGVSRRTEVPHRGASGLEWRRMLPVSLTYDHRVLNGADVGRFLDHLRRSLASPADLDAVAA